MADDDVLTDPPTPVVIMKVAKVELSVPPPGAWAWVMGVLDADGRFVSVSTAIHPVRDVSCAGFRRDILQPGLEALQQQLGHGPLITLH